ncbi:hypothetical protein [Parasitella parasitica]|uniref:Protein kinase domain-containing protein n=1 Tax=Parasitella parasitica TaxID=35722 RepID=A0A0B7N740_9FUNG|nr:hypothetical protein [Parasitella parasitica]
MASSTSNFKNTQNSKRELSPSSSFITAAAAKKSRLDILFDNSTQEDQVSDLAVGDDFLSSIGAQTPTFENRMGSLLEPGSGYDRSPTRDSINYGSSMAHDLLGIDEDIDEDDEEDDEDEYFNDAIDIDQKPYRRSLYSELVSSSNLPDDEERRKSNLIPSSLFDHEEEDEEGATDFEDKTTMPLSRSYAQRAQPTSFDDEVDRLFSSHNPADEPEFVLSSAMKMSILQRQHQHGPLWQTDKPHFLTDSYFRHHGPQDRSIPTSENTLAASATSYFDCKFEKLGAMGSGEFAQVWKVRCLATNKVYAVKKSKNSFTGWDDRWQQLIEVDHLRRVKDRKYCVNMINAWEERGYLYIQLELCPSGSLDKYIQFKNKRITEDIVWQIFYQVVLGIQDIHAANIAHLDLKPSNILIDGKGNLKIGDFGISIQTPVDMRWVKGEGDRRYMAPDLLRENFDKPADIFSLGLVLLELATGVELPGTGESWEMLRLGDFSKQKLALSKLSLEMSEMIEWLLTTEAKERPTVKDIMSHPSFTHVQSTQQDMETSPLSHYTRQHANIDIQTPSSRLNHNLMSTSVVNPETTSRPASSQAQSVALNVVDFVKNKSNFYLTRLDRELSKHQCANDIERRTGLPKAYVVLGTSTVFFLMIFFNVGAQLLTNAISWIYPAYASFKAIETPNTDDDTQWLTYWTVIGFAQMIEYFSDILLYWFPFYYTFKTIFVLWLILPQFRGAQVAYQRFLRPFLLNAQTEIDRHANKFTKPFNSSPAGDKAE